MSDAVSNASALRLSGVTRAFEQGGARLEVLRGVELSVARGEVVALVGPSGAGKSTLLQIAGLLERPDGGAVHVGAEDAGGLDDSGRTRLRRRSIGFVYQFHHLLPEFSAVENVMLPAMIAGIHRSEAKARALELLAAVGLGGRAGHRPAKLSGGEQQRVAIVRALVNRPGLLIADEPTGNLDPATAEVVFEMLMTLARREGVGALIATHNPDLARRMDRMTEMRDGRVAEIAVGGITPAER